MATMQSITQSILTEIHDLSGQDVQVYTQPVIYRKIQSIFNQEFRSRWWNRFTARSVGLQLDGVTGHVTTDLSALIKDARDLRNIWITGTRSPLPMIPANVPLSIVTQLSYVPNSVAANGFFTVIPVTSTYTVDLLFRTKPKDFIATDEIPFDEEYMIQKVAGDLTIDEGVNVTAGKRFLDAAKNIRQKLIVDEAESMSFYSPTSTGLTDWATR